MATSVYDRDCVVVSHPYPHLLMELCKKYHKLILETIVHTRTCDCIIYVFYSSLSATGYSDAVGVKYNKPDSRQVLLSLIG